MLFTAFPPGANIRQGMARLFVPTAKACAPQLVAFGRVEASLADLPKLDSEKSKLWLATVSLLWVEAVHAVTYAPSGSGTVRRILPSRIHTRIESLRVCSQWNEPLLRNVMASACYPYRHPTYASKQ